VRSYADVVRAELTIEIARPPEEVFAYLTDLSNLPAWQSGVHGAEVVGGGEPRVGARIAESRHFLGRELHTTLEIFEYEPPRLFSLRALDGPVPFSVRHELERAVDATRLAVSAEGDAGPVPGFAAGMVTRRVEKQFRKDFERLKRLLES
jgi:carbon monoxide dehydrogenase subunit G